MEELAVKTVESLVEYGVLGIWLMSTMVFIYKMYADQKKEREDNRTRFSEQHEHWRMQVHKLYETANSQAERNHQQLVELTKETSSILSEIKTLICNKK